MEYAIQQAAAIAQEGVEVYFLCKPSFPVERLGAGIILEKFQEPRGARGESRGLAGKLSTIWRLTLGQRRNAKQVAKLAYQLAQPSSTRHQLPATRDRPSFAEVVVLFACYKEYFSPFWAGPLRQLANKGAVIGTIAHDPVRDFVMGPLWWHRWCVRLGYSFVRHVFVHDDTPVDFGGAQPQGIQIHQIPHGPYEVCEPKIGRLEMRKRLGFSSDLTIEDTTERLGGREMEQTKVGLKGEGVGTTESKSAAALATPASPDVVFLAFGQIRDGKNLDLFLRAMTRLPHHVKLLVAGKGDSGSSKRPEFYQNLAQELGVADRCRWDIRRIPEEEVGDIFAACDLVLVTYSANFCSASGVLNAAVSARKLVLASSGSGPLKTVVEKYHLGVFVEPDDLEETLRGALQLMDALSSSATQNLDNRRSTLDAFFPPVTTDSPHDTAGVLLPAWDRYESDNSWKENATIVMNLISSSSGNS
jgi:glycosyltransferase involved in cell wall biosynthesis